MHNCGLLRSCVGASRGELCACHLVSGNAHAPIILFSNTVNAVEKAKLRNLDTCLKPGKQSQGQGTGGSTIWNRIAPQICCVGGCMQQTHFYITISSSDILRYCRSLIPWNDGVHGTENGNSDV